MNDLFEICLLDDETVYAVASNEGEALALFAEKDSREIDFVARVSGSTDAQACITMESDTEEEAKATVDDLMAAGGHPFYRETTDTVSGASVAFEVADTLANWRKLTPRVFGFGLHKEGT